MIVAFTGQRSVGANLARSAMARTETLRLLKFLQPTMCISGMALGYDLVAAQACVDSGVPFTAAVPFEGQEAHWGPTIRERYRKLLSAAAKVVMVSEGGYMAQKFQDRNEWMVDQADLVLACWDGSKGGTRNCVMYAVWAGTDILWMNCTVEPYITVEISCR